MRSNDPAGNLDIEFSSGHVLAAEELFELNGDLSGYGPINEIGWIRNLLSPLAALDFRDGVWRFTGASAGWLHALELSLPEIETRRPEEVLSREAALPLIQAADRVHAGAGESSVTVPVRLPDRRTRRLKFTLHALSATTVVIEMSTPPRPPAEGRNGGGSCSII